MFVSELTKTRAVMGLPKPVAFSAVSGMASPSRKARPDDSVLVERAQQGDTAAFEELVKNYDRTVLRLALHLTDSPDDAQDIYQEAFLRAYCNLDRFRFECSFYTWIYRIVTNLCFDHLRKKQLRDRYAYAEPYSSDGDDREDGVLERAADQRAGTSPERALLSQELRERIGWALGRLSPRERVVFELKHYQGLKLQTVADILNTTENTIKNTLFRATQKLRAELVELR